MEKKYNWSHQLKPDFFVEVSNVQTTALIAIYTKQFAFMTPLSVRERERERKNCEHMYMLYDKEYTLVVL